MKSNSKFITLAFIGIFFIFAILQLPYYFPPMTPSFSSSYEVGYNNKIAIFIVWIAMLTFAFIGFSSKNNLKVSPVDTNDNYNKISKKHLIIALTFTVLFIFICFICVGDDLNNGGESSYFIFSVKQMVFGLVPYTSTENNAYVVADSKEITSPIHKTTNIIIVTFFFLSIIYHFSFLLLI